MNKELEKLFDQYEGNLLNYFAGLTPEQSKKFNEMQKQKFCEDMYDYMKEQIYQKKVKPD